MVQFGWNQFSVRSLISVVLVSTSLLLATSRQANAQSCSVSAVNQYKVNGNVAEIVSASPDGNTLAFTNSEDQQVGFVDIRDPKNPRELGTVDVSSLGEPTSVAITPNGRYAVVAVLNKIVEGQTIADQKPGTLVFIDLNTRQIAGQVTLAGIGPDSVAITPNGRQAVVAIEDEEDTENLPGQRPGSINIVTIDENRPSNSRVASVPLNLAGIQGVNFTSDPQPEFVAISPNSQTAAVTLQENNGIAIVDLRTARITRIFSAGTASHPADLKDDGQVKLTESFTGRREPDAIQFTPDGRYLITANEGDTDPSENVYSGGRGWTIFDLNGRVVYDSGSSVEEQAAQQGRYPDDRSERRGVELEGAAVGQLQGKPIAVIGSERGSFLVIYDLTNLQQPQPIGFVPTGESPEGVIVIPRRNLILSANEGDGTIDLFQVNCSR